MPNTSKDASNLASNDFSENLNNTANNLSKKSDINNFAELPVLAKDSYYLSRLERELARTAVFKNKKTNKDAENATNDKQHKAEKELAKNVRSTTK